jgi:hypothetical protein
VVEVIDVIDVIGAIDVINAIKRVGFALVKRGAGSAA